MMRRRKNERAAAMLSEHFYLKTKEVTKRGESISIGSTSSSQVKSARRLLPLLIVTVLPAILNKALWWEVWLGAQPRAWDGTGHYALAQIYDQSIFPSTFGWTHAFFGGMPFPNFYPPLFYWCVALLSHSHLFSLDSAFKLVVALPVLCLPAAVWALAWATLGKNRSAATASALAIIPLLVDYRLMYPLGLNHAGSFLIGLYTQPLGFLLLVAWYVSYINAHRRRWRMALSCVLLALTVLTNFFCAATAALLASATIAFDFLNCCRARGSDNYLLKRWVLIAHLSTPFVAGGLALFWLAPMFSQYDYLVTRPHTAPSMNSSRRQCGCGICWQRSASPSGYAGPPPLYGHT